MISTEIEELVELCDRIAVMSRGEITGVVENDARGRGARRRADGGAREERAGEGSARHSWARRSLTAAVPIVLALVANGILLAALGRDPFTFYADMFQRGLLEWDGLSGEHHPQRAAAADRGRA